MPRPSNWLFNVILTCLVAFGAVSTDLYLATIPQIVEAFNSTPAMGQLTLSIYMFGFAFGQLAMGPLSDWRGRKPILLLGLYIYLVGSFACLFAVSMPMLLLGRLIQGLGASAAPALARAIVADLYEGREAAKVLSYLTSAMALIPAIAPVIGSTLLLWFDWRSNFAALLLFCVLVIIGTSLFIPETNQQRGGDKPTLRLVTHRFKQFLSDQTFVAYVVCSSAVFGGMFAYISSTSFIIVDVLKLPVHYFGYTFMFVVIGYIVGAVVSGRLVQKKGIVSVMGMGIYLSVIASTLGVLSALLHYNTLASVLLPVFLYFMAAGLTVANGQAGAFGLFRSSAGGAASVFGFLQISFAALTGVLVGQLYDHTTLPTMLIMFTLSISSLLFYRMSLYKKITA
ncbi:MAG: multidrug effflux MFS transporter [Gammaproteobacteria bacterium]|nr:multidrug effflux MFS transporter [Gammaproteobacteria bacterium]